MFAGELGFEGGGVGGVGEASEEGSPDPDAAELDDDGDKYRQRACARATFRARVGV